MPEPRTALSAPINPVTSSSELLDALAVAAVGGVLIGMSGRKTAGSALVRMAGYAMLGLAARPFISAAVRKAKFPSMLRASIPPHSMNSPAKAKSTRPKAIRP